MFVVETVPYTNRTHLVRHSPRDPCEYNYAGSSRIIDKTSGAVHWVLDKGNEESVRANRVINKIVSGARLGNKADWQVAVLERDGVNARYMGGGWIWITRGLLARLSSDAEVGWVLAHEITHGIARHSSEMLAVFVKRHRKLVPNFLAMPVYRRQEVEADYIGIMLLAVSGLDPHATLQALEKVAAVMGT